MRNRKNLVQCMACKHGKHGKRCQVKNNGHYYSAHWRRCKEFESATQFCGECLHFFVGKPNHCNHYGGKTNPRLNADPCPSFSRAKNVIGIH